MSPVHQRTGNRGSPSWVIHGTVIIHE